MLTNCKLIWPHAEIFDEILIFKKLRIDYAVFEALRLLGVKIFPEYFRRSPKGSSIQYYIHIQCVPKFLLRT